MKTPTLTRPLVLVLAPALKAKMDADRAARRHYGNTLYLWRAAKVAALDLRIQL